MIWKTVSTKSPLLAAQTCCGIWKPIQSLQPTFQSPNRVLAKQYRIDLFNDRAGKHLGFVCSNRSFIPWRVLNAIASPIENVFP